MVVNPRGDREPGRYGNLHGGRFEDRNNPDQVHRQDEHEQRAEERRILLRVFHAHLGSLVLDETVHQFKYVLKFSGLVG